MRLTSELHRCIEMTSSEPASDGIMLELRTLTTTIGIYERRAWILECVACLWRQTQSLHNSP